MMDKSKILNFTWQLSGQLATGGKPTYSEQLDWLMSQGISAILSLEEIPDSLESMMTKRGIAHLVVEVPDDYEEGSYRKRKPTTNPEQLVSYFGYVTDMPMNDWKKITMFINSNIESGKKVFVHCSAGIRRSPRVANNYLRQQISLIGWWRPSVEVYDYSFNNIWMLACEMFGQVFIFDSYGVYKRLDAKEISFHGRRYPSKNFQRLEVCRILIEYNSRCNICGRYQFQIGSKRWKSIRSHGGIGVYEPTTDWKLEDVVSDIYWQSRCLNGKGLLANTSIVREDNYNWLFAHQSLLEDRAKEAIEILILALDEDDRKNTLRKTAANALTELFRHRTCGCFNQESLVVMRKAHQCLEKTLTDTLAGKYTLPTDRLMKSIVQSRIEDSIQAFREAINAHSPHYHHPS